MRFSSRSSFAVIYSTPGIPVAFEASRCAKNICSTWRPISKSGNTSGFDEGVARASAAVSLTVAKSSFQRATTSSILDGRYVRTNIAASGSRFAETKSSAHASTLPVSKLATNATLLFPYSAAAAASLSIPAKFPTAEYSNRRSE